MKELADGVWHIKCLPGLPSAVNAYLAGDVLIDAGCRQSTSRILKQLDGHEVRVHALTHAHPDHVADLSRLATATGAPIYLSSREQADCAQPIEEGKKFRVGELEIESRLTWGHSPGGMTFVVHGLARPVAIVGDSLFAGSMGGGNVSYEEAVKNNREKILSLANDTILCPGHGPMTTVGEEKQHNPFFAA